jgi:hypothetical protein
MVDDFRIALADAGGFQNDEVEMRGFQDSYRGLDVFGKCQIALAGRQRAHVHAVVELMAFMRMRSPSKRAARFAFGWVDRDDGDGFVGKSSKKRRTSSSTIEDFPAPPVPVMPRIGERTPERCSGSVAVTAFGVHGGRFFQAPGLFSAMEMSDAPPMRPVSPFGKLEACNCSIRH